MGTSRSRLGDESGAVAATVAVSLTVLLMMAAFVIDLALLRVDQVSGKAVADMAAAAASYELAEDESANDVCRQALGYTAANLPGDDAPEALPGMSCDDIFHSGFECEAVPSSNSPPTARYLVGRYEIAISMPVFDASVGETLMQDLDHEEYDGEPCDRVGVRISRDREFLLAGIGDMLTQGRSDPGSVGRVARGETFESFPSLVVLQREGDSTLYTHGGGNLRVLSLQTAEHTYPGIISVDTAYGGDAVIRVDGTSSVRAEDGHIFSFARNTNTVQEVTSGGGTLEPDPEPGDLISRQTIDHRYNCQPDGYEAGASYDPSSSQVDQIDECPGTDTSYIRSLHNSLRGPGTPSTGTWRVLSGGDCTGFDGTHTDDSNWFMDCDTFRPGNLTLENVENVVFRGNLRLGNSNHQFNVNGHSSRGANLVIRDGDIDVGGGALRLRNVFTYHISGVWNMRGNPDSLLMQGPLDDAACSAGSPPPAACFTPLAYWSNVSSATHVIRGGATGGIIGTIFMPNSEFLLRGEAPPDPNPCDGNISWSDLVLADTSSTLNLDGAQFYAHSFDLAGGSELRMCPSPSTTIPEPFTSSGLIR